MTGNLSAGPQQVFILTGDTGTGKSTFLADLSAILKGLDLHIGGFIARAGRGPAAARSYELMDLASARNLPLASGDPGEGWIKTGGFYFNPEALRLGNHILLDPDIDKFDLVIVDEIGPFELEGRIWSGAVTHLRKNRTRPMIWTVRKPLIEKVAVQWQLKDPVILDVEKLSPGQAAGMIFPGLQQNSGD